MAPSLWISRGGIDHETRVVVSQRPWRQVVVDDLVRRSLAHANQTDERLGAVDRVVVVEVHLLEQRSFGKVQRERRDGGVEHVVLTRLQEVADEDLEGRRGTAVMGIAGAERQDDLVLGSVGLRPSGGELSGEERGSGGGQESEGGDRRSERAWDSSFFQSGWNRFSTGLFSRRTAFSRERAAAVKRISDSRRRGPATTQGAGLA